MDDQTFKNPRIWIGFIIIVLGSLLLLRNFDILDFTIPDIIFSWKSILIIIGIIIIASSNNLSAGILFIGIGLIAHFPEFWPVILIALGLYILIKRGGSVSKSNGCCPPEVSHEYLNDISIFGGGKKYIHTDNFKGGKVTAVFGGSEIDLLDSNLAEGHYVLDIFAMFGGTTLLIPKDWKVEVKLVPILGGFTDKRKKDPNLVYREDRSLRIKGLVLFGGGEIRN
ncbi:LiaI-LiaF-like domain-containing protein [Bacteroidota bacterium]